MWLWVPQRWDKGSGRRLNSEREDRVSGLSLASALSAQSRAFPLSHHPGAGVGCRDPQRDPLREKGRGLRVDPSLLSPSWHLRSGQRRAGVLASEVLGWGTAGRTPALEKTVPQANIPDQSQEPLRPPPAPSPPRHGLLEPEQVKTQQLAGGVSGRLLLGPGAARPGSPLPARLRSASR